MLVLVLRVKAGVWGREGDQADAAVRRTGQSLDATVTLPLRTARCALQWLQFCAVRCPTRRRLTDPPSYGSGGEANNERPDPGHSSTTTIHQPQPTGIASPAGHVQRCVAQLVHCLRVRLVVQQQAHCGVVA